MFRECLDSRVPFRAVLMTPLNYSALRNEFQERVTGDLAWLVQQISLLAAFSSSKTGLLSWILDTKRYAFCSASTSTFWLH